MKIDMTTNIDREIRQIGMTADHTSRPDKVLFFADPHFLFVSQRTIGTFDFAQYTSQTIAKSKEPILCRPHESREYKQLITNFKK